MITLSFTNFKGGVTKSTMTATVAVGLAALGWRVGIIDTDPQGHVALMLDALPRLGDDIQDVDGLYNVLVAKQPLAEQIRRVPDAVIPRLPGVSPSGEIYVLPSAVKTTEIEGQLTRTDVLAFPDLVRRMEQEYMLDILLVDTKPSKDKLDGLIALAIDSYVFVTLCERLPMDGLVRAMAEVEGLAEGRQRHLNRQTRILGVLPNLYERGTLVHDSNLQKMREAFSELCWEPIAKGTIWRECVNSYRTILTYAPRTIAATQAWDVIRKVEALCLPVKIS